jgi:ArsR family transcriptional regulator
MNDMRRLVKIFKALGDTNRIRILKMLEVRALCVCEIREVLGLANSTVSKHLSILRDAEFILDIKDGKWVEYQLNTTRTDQYVKKLLPLIQFWLPEDGIVIKDRKKVKKVNRNIICGL